jgi:hypothetical protein
MYLHADEGARYTREWGAGGGVLDTKVGVPPKTHAGRVGTSTPETPNRAAREQSVGVWITPHRTVTYYLDDLGHRK